MDGDDGKNLLIDLARLRDRFDDDEELLAEIFRVFVAEAPGRRQEFEAALERGDMGRLAHQAHSLKGVAATMFAEPLRRAAYALETAAKAGDAAAAGGLTQAVLALLVDTCGHVSGLL
ncbi:Hpt domain-containing protein [Solidesulfovibrio sp.]|uniref:Hpt domain-containing protein n=1 Tax=Solidesulfovibrio sp. TaxID=2910990 RepID=UPI002621A884|nr:Hpt domain-containing protein [Solidesulfovibrio sp.]